MSTLLKISHVTCTQLSVGIKTKLSRNKIILFPFDQLLISPLDYIRGFKVRNVVHLAFWIYRFDKIKHNTSSGFIEDIIT